VAAEQEQHERAVRQGVEAAAEQQLHGTPEDDPGPCEQRPGTS
jgi:hypothetical protein